MCPPHMISTRPLYRLCPPPPQASASAPPPADASCDIYNTQTFDYESERVTSDCVSFYPFNTRLIRIQHVGTCSLLRLRLDLLADILPASRPTRVPPSNPYPPTRRRTQQPCARLQAKKATPSPLAKVPDANSVYIICIIFRQGIHKHLPHLGRGIEHYAHCFCDGTLRYFAVKFLLWRGG